MLGKVATGSRGEAACGGFGDAKGLVKGTRTPRRECPDADEEICIVRLIEYCAADGSPPRAPVSATALVDREYLLQTTGSGVLLLPAPGRTSGSSLGMPFEGLRAIESRGDGRLVLRWVSEDARGGPGEGRRERCAEAAESPAAALHTAVLALACAEDAARLSARLSAACRDSLEAAPRPPSRIRARAERGAGRSSSRASRSGEAAGGGPGSSPPEAVEASVAAKSPPRPDPLTPLLAAVRGPSGGWGEPSELRGWGSSAELRAEGGPPTGALVLWLAAPGGPVRAELPTARVDAASGAAQVLEAAVVGDNAPGGREAPAGAIQVRVQVLDPRGGAPASRRSALDPSGWWPVALAPLTSLGAAAASLPGGPAAAIPLLLSALRIASVILWLLAPALLGLHLLGVLSQPGTGADPLSAAAAWLREAGCPLIGPAHRGRAGGTRILITPLGVAGSESYREERRPPTLEGGGARAGAASLRLKAPRGEPGAEAPDPSAEPSAASVEARSGGEGPSGEASEPSDLPAPPATPRALRSHFVAPSANASAASSPRASGPPAVATPFAPHEEWRPLAHASSEGGGGGAAAPETGAGEADGRLASLPAAIRELHEEEPDELPADQLIRFYHAMDGDEGRAVRAARKLVEWLDANGARGLLSRPQPFHAAVKAAWRHGVLCLTRDGKRVVEIEATGLLPRALADLAAGRYDSLVAPGPSGAGEPLPAPEAGSGAEAGGRPGAPPAAAGGGEAAPAPPRPTRQDALLHLAFCNSYVAQEVDPAPWPEGQVVKILDLEGLRFSDLRSEGFRLIADAAGMLGLTRPQRLHIAFLVNAPSWWALAWRVISPLMEPKVAGKFRVFRAGEGDKAAAALLEYVHEDDLPTAYGGKRVAPLGDGPFERRQADFASRLNAPRGAE